MPNLGTGAELHTGSRPERFEIRGGLEVFLGESTVLVYTLKRLFNLCAGVRVRHL